MAIQVACVMFLSAMCSYSSCDCGMHEPAPFPACLEYVRALYGSLVLNVLALFLHSTNFWVTGLYVFLFDQNNMG